MREGTSSIKIILEHISAAFAAVILLFVCTLPARTADFAPTPNILPTDVTPIQLRQERGIISPYTKFRIYQKLPERLWFNVTTELSQRLDTNVLFTSSNPLSDYAFRAAPDVTVGYNLLDNTSIYTDYFAIKDVFAQDYQSISKPTTQSLGWGILHDLPISAKTDLQFNFLARELWQEVGLRQSDLIPSLNLTRIVTPRTVVFGNALLQMRSGEYFEGPTRELDPFYTLGLLHRRGLWGFIATDTLVNNFRSPPFSNSVPHAGNVSMIATFEVYHPIVTELPSVVAFLRVQPIWNWRSQNTPGISGFDFRLMTGIRMTVGKQAYSPAMSKLRNQIIESQKAAHKAAPIKQPVSDSPSQPSPSLQQKDATRSSTPARSQPSPQQEPQAASPDSPTLLPPIDINK